MIGKFAQRPEAAPWGLLASLDIYQCSPDIIGDAGQIKRYVLELCDLIEMKRFGECQVVHFGQDERVAGYSMIQLIETSLISGHFSDQTHAAYIDIFSCKPYDPDLAAGFTKNFFQGKDMAVHVTRRM